MNKINLSKDLEDFSCFRTRTLAYYFGYWYENESQWFLLPNENIDKEYLYEIYKYLVDIKPEIQDIWHNNIYYHDILKILDVYKNKVDDSTGKSLLFDINRTLIEKSV